METVVRQTKHSDLRHVKVYVDVDNRVYVDDDNTWEQPRRDCVNIYWKDHIWQVENKNKLILNGSHEGTQAELEWKQAWMEWIPTNMLDTFKDFDLTSTLHYHARFEWD